MSTPQVLEQTLERARGRGLRCELLPMTFDVDELADLARLRAELEGSPGLLPATSAVLVSLALDDVIEERVAAELHEA